MSSLEISTNIGCKVNCAYCPQSKLVKAYYNRGDVPKIMTFDVFKTVLNKIPSNVIIEFSGFSEPWLNHECTAMLLHTYYAGYEVGVFTTAVGMNNNDLEKIKSLLFRRFCLHLPDMEGYAKIKLSNDYLATIDAIVNAKIHNFDFMTMGTLPREVKKIIGNRISSTKMVSRAGNLLGQSDIEIPHYLKGSIRCRSCGDSFDHNVMLPNGDVVLCCYDFGLQHVLGNLITSDYGMLFTNETINQLRNSLDDDSVDILCRHCENASTINDYEYLEKKKIHMNKNDFFKNIRTVFGAFRKKSLTIGGD
jgi:sulfatase maturation enzyme AslB (radical SAM superfamily)